MSLKSKQLKLFDIALNWGDDMFRGVYHGKKYHADDSLQVIERAKAAGVQKFIFTGTDLEESRKCLELAKGQDCFYSTVGCHPTRCTEFESDPDKYYDELLQLAKSAPGKVVAIGECGLDLDRLHFCPLETQKKYFDKQFGLAELTKLPMFLHNRNTNGLFVEIMKQNRHRFSGGVVHSFDGTVDEMKQLTDELGLYIGINGCSLKTEENLEVVKQIPREKLMLETDAPWCDIRPSHASYKHLNNFKPEPSQLCKKEKFTEGKMIKGRNEPCNISQVLEVVASIRGEDIHELAEAIYENTNQLFGIS